MAVARDAALRGLSVLLLEAGDLASGTSGRSSKLIHGGIRYLETGQLGLVREALRERSVLLETAPEYVRPLPFLIPHYQGDGRSRARVGLGLALYAALAGRRGIGGHRRLAAEEALALEPKLAHPGLRGASLFWDAQMEDAGLCVALALHAEAAGAGIRTHTSLAGLRRDGNVWRARHRDSIDGAEDETDARIVVNAAGPWADEIRGMALARAPAASMRRTRGTHVVLPDLTVARAILLTARGDGRVLFVMPWRGHTLIGTTDTDDDEGPRAPLPHPDEIRYLTVEAARAIPAAKGVRPVRAFAGLRSLVRGGAERPWANSREHRVLAEDGMLTLIGGKYTTHRSLAERVVDRVAATLGARVAPCRTATTPVPSGRAAAIEALRGRFPGRIDLEGGLSLTEAEAAHAAATEKALRLEDVLLRRTRLWLDGRALRRAADTAASWIAPILGWSERRRREEIEWMTRSLDDEERAIEEGTT